MQPWAGASPTELELDLKTHQRDSYRISLNFLAMRLWELPELAGLGSKDLSGC